MHMRLWNGVTNIYTQDQVRTLQSNVSSTQLKRRISFQEMIVIQPVGQLHGIHLGVQILTLGPYGLENVFVFVSFFLQVNGKNARIQNGLKIGNKIHQHLLTHFQDDTVNEGQNVTFASEDYGRISDLIQPSMHNLIRFCCDLMLQYI